MKVKITEVIKEGSPILPENPLPVFRDRDHNFPEKKLHESLEERHKHLVGYECSRRVLPYRMQDRYGRDRIPLSIKTAVLENEHLRAEFYVEYGGRLTSLYDKDNNKELVKNNPVFQPGNLAIRDAWLATGIEFNCSHFGHHFLTCSSLYAAKVMDEDGQEFLRMYEYERCKGIFYQMDFHLPSGSKFLYLYAKIINPKTVPVSTYWWTNIDLPEEAGVRVFSASDEVIYYMSPEQLEDLPGYNILAVGHIPHLGSRPGLDLSYPRNFDYSTDYFFQIPETVDMPWEAAAYPDGFVMYEASTGKLRYRKVFCWGTGSGGAKWQDFLSRPGEGNFFEIQAGLAPTQIHGYILRPEETMDFVQAFGSMYCDPKELMDPDWSKGQKLLDGRIRDTINSNMLEELHVRFQRHSLIEPVILLHTGSGFGALELRRLEMEGKSYDTGGMVFPDANIGKEETLWLDLLEKGSIPDMPVDVASVSYMVQDEWKDMLERSLTIKENRNWHSLLHYGIMLAETGDFEAAVKTFERSMSCRESVWALRNIGHIYKTENKTKEALECYEKLFGLPGAFSDQGFAEEYMDILLSEKLYEQAWGFFCTIPDELKIKDRLALQSGEAAVETGRLDHVEDILKRDFSVIREGENSTSDIWFKYKARKLAQERKIPYTKVLLSEVMDNYDPPAEIDFRMQPKKKKVR
jgi:tetratricopeptide (TPR) repeat protein